MLDVLLAWANTRAAPRSTLGKALSYLREQWPYLLNYLKDGRLELGNNRAERSIKGDYVRRSQPANLSVRGRRPLRRLLRTARRCPQDAKNARRQRDCLLRRSAVCGHSGFSTGFRTSQRGAHIKSLLDVPQSLRRSGLYGSPSAMARRMLFTQGVGWKGAFRRTGFSTSGSSGQCQCSSGSS